MNDTGTRSEVKIVKGTTLFRGTMLVPIYIEQLRTTARTNTTIKHYMHKHMFYQQMFGLPPWNSQYTQVHWGLD